MYVYRSAYTRFGFKLGTWYLMQNIEYSERQDWTVFFDQQAQKYLTHYTEVLIHWYSGTLLSSLALVMACHQFIAKP